MEVAAEKKSNVQMIIDAMLHHGPVKSKEISEIVTEMAGKEVKVQDVASMLSRLSNEAKCDLGYFIKKEKDGNSYRYSFVEEFQPLGDETAYGLTLRTGQHQVALDDLLEEKPELKPYVENPRTKPRRTRKKGARLRAPAQRTKSRRGPGRPPKNPATITANAMEAVSSLADVLENLQDLNIHVSVTVKFEDLD
jgi:predicted transcriptional regulator